MYAAIDYELDTKYAWTTTIETTGKTSCNSNNFADVGPEANDQDKGCFCEYSPFPSSEIILSSSQPPLIYDLNLDPAEEYSILTYLNCEQGSVADGNH
jgi:hypothetical protein